MNVIGQGLSKRFAIVDTDETGAAVVEGRLQAEIDADSPLKNRQFEDSKLHENVISYINVLDESMDVLANYQYQSAEYYEHWEDVYDKRTQILKTFVDKYGISNYKARTKRHWMNSSPMEPMLPRNATRRRPSTNWFHPRNSRRKIKGMVTSPTLPSSKTPPIFPLRT